MRLTTKTNLAARVLMVCAFHGGKTLRTSDSAQVSNASLNRLLQGVNGLQVHGFIEMLRGRHGGLRLARPPEQVSMGAVFRVFEAGIPLPHGSTQRRTLAHCPRNAACGVTSLARSRRFTMSST